MSASTDTQAGAPVAGREAQSRDVANDPARVQRRHLVLLGFVYLTIVVAHLAWDHSTQRMPTFDQAAHLTKGIVYADAIANGTFLHEFWSPAIYPPAYQVLLGLGTLIFGASSAVGLYVNLAALAVIMWGTYVLGTQLATRTAGLLAATLIATYPGVVIYSREALQETVLTAVTVVSLVLLNATRTFQERRASILLGLTMGLGFLVKPNFGFYLWLPVAVTGVLSLRHASRARLANLAICAVLTVAVTALWYFPERENLLTLMHSNREDAIAYGFKADPWSGFTALRANFATEVTTYLGEYIALLALIVCVVRAPRRYWMLMTSIVGAWAIVVLLLVLRDVKYLLATLPATAVLVAVVLDGTRPTWFRRASITTLLAAQVVSAAAAESGRINLSAVPLLETRNFYAGSGGSEPSLTAVVERMSSSGPSRLLNVAIVPNDYRWNANTLNWAARRMRASLQFEPVSFGGYSEDGAFQRLAAADWVLLKTGDQGVPATVVIADSLSQRVRNSPDRFELAGALPAADGSEAQIYRVLASSVASATDAQIADLVSASALTFRDVSFGDRFRLLGLAIHHRTEGVWGSQGAVVRMAWEAMTSGPLDRLVCVHLVDDAGRILGGADYPQSRHEGARVVNGVRWIDEVLLVNEKLAGATGIGLCIYHSTQPHLPVDRGPRDWDGVRLRIPLPVRAGTTVR